MAGEVLEEFLAELGELLNTLERDLVSVDGGRDPSEVVAQTFRVFHSVKGTAGFLGYDHLREISHAAGDLLDAIREGTVAWSPPPAPATGSPATAPPTAAPPGAVPPAPRGRPIARAPSTTSSPACLAWPATPPRPRASRCARWPPGPRLGSTRPCSRPSRARCSSEIARSIPGVAEAARHTSQGRADTQKASAELTRMAAELQRMISRFAV